MRRVSNYKPDVSLTETAAHNNLEKKSDKINREVGDEQAGFRKNSGIREGIFNLKNDCGKIHRNTERHYACFIDYS